MNSAVSSLNLVDVAWKHDFLVGGRTRRTRERDISMLNAGGRQVGNQVHMSILTYVSTLGEKNETKGSLVEVADEEDEEEGGREGKSQPPAWEKKVIDGRPGNCTTSWKLN